jgi:predicted Zn-dependent protease with MMP-like domain
MQKLNWNELCQLATREIEAVLEQLPSKLRERAVALPITFEPTPNPQMQTDGIESDTLGLFTGPEFAEEGHIPMPPQIILFLENLREFAKNDEKVLRKEVATTFLHELGHYLGLDEEDLAERGLE